MIHKAQCPDCGWKYPCTCNAPNADHGPCFECAAKAPSAVADGTSPPDPAPESPQPKIAPPDESWDGWGRRW